MTSGRRTQILIIGAGLAGLGLARRLEAAGADYCVVEARSRPGGRILSLPAGGAGFDLGPAWFWPGQPRIAQLAQDLGIEAFEQYADGGAIFQAADGLVRRGLRFSTMAGALRLSGGMAALSDAMARSLPAGRLLLDHRVTALSRKDGHIEASMASKGQPLTIAAAQAVLALPPRLAAQIRLTPELAREQVAALMEIPTWMAGHAKIVAVYPTPFWRAAGLSGDAVSERGPLAEIHDASPVSGLPGALFGFVATPPAARIGRMDDIKRAAVGQLAELFGPHARQPLDVLAKDWCADAETSTALDYRPLAGHPAYGLPRRLSRLWDGRLILASTEIGAANGGLLEGALEAGEAAWEALSQPAAP